MQIHKPRVCLWILIAILASSSMTIAQHQRIAKTNDVSSTPINYPVTTTFEVSETAINRFIQNQYSVNSIPQTVTVSIGGIAYTLTLDLPTIILQQDIIKMHMAIGINPGNNSVAIEPSLNISSWNISLTSISSTFSNLASVVNALSIDANSKTAIINAYSPLVISLYPSNFLSQINTSAFSQEGLKLLEPTLTFTINPGSLQFVITIPIQSEPPSFRVELNGFVGDDFVAFYSNIQAVVKEVTIVAMGSGVLIYHGYPNVTIPKYQSMAIDIGDVGIQGNPGNPLSSDRCIIRARFQSDYTWFTREYSQVYVNLQLWTDATVTFN